MEEYYGGGIPFSSVLKDTKKTKKRKRKTIKSRRTRNAKKMKTRNYNNDSVYKDAKINKQSRTPEGLGFCADCCPLNIMMRGKDNKLYEIKKDNKGRKLWILI